VKTEDVRLVTDVNPLDGPEGTYQVGIDFATWLQSATEEIEVDGLRVEGNIPAWLRGSWVHAAPAKFEFGDDEFVDWVDGQAMLYRVQIKGDGECQYKNKWLDTFNHRSHREAGRIAVRETCSRPTLWNPLDRLSHLFSPPNNENGNLHISQFGGTSRCISMSVGSSLMEFQLDGLKTIGKVPFADDMKDDIMIFHAEPHMDYKTGEWYSVAVNLKISKEEMGMKPEYTVFSIPGNQPAEAGAPVNRRHITTVKTDSPSPIHTIALTEKYMVMIQIPYPLNWDGMMSAEGKWLLTGKYEGNLNDYNTWEPWRNTQIRLIDKQTGEQLTPFETDPFFFFHVINSFEEKGGASGSDDCVFLDVVCYNQPPVGFPLKQARSGDVDSWRGGGGEVRRFCMNITTGECDWTGWKDNCFDEPKINPKVDGVRHRYSWGVIDDNGMLRLTKQDHDTHEILKWKGQDVTCELPWQPVFVPEPYSEREDAGVLMSYVRDQVTGNNYGIVLDAANMEELARIHFPEGHHIPLHGHGTWMQGDF
jgi:carotenoid cleavage dioxygenase-like enzyme